MRYNAGRRSIHRKPSMRSFSSVCKACLVNILADISSSVAAENLSLNTPALLRTLNPSAHRKESKMANDPGLSGDTCIFMEAVTGDGGVHNSSGVWWLSPDIQ